MPGNAKFVAIVNYGLGNIFSIMHALQHVCLDSKVTSDSREILDAAAVILPGVGAFGDAMEALERLDLIKPLQDFAQSGKPLIGICLGQHLLFTESQEFGVRKGLDIFSGEVVPFKVCNFAGHHYKVPQVGWNHIYAPDFRVREPGYNQKEFWNTTLLKRVDDGAYMYFVHSFYAIPDDTSITLSKTVYGHTEFCSSVKKGSVQAFQFHPERSGKVGMQIYHNLKENIGQNDL